MSYKIVNFTIRLATNVDLPQITHVANVTWQATYHNAITLENQRDFLAQLYKPEILANSLTAMGQWLYVSQVENKVVGFGHFVQRYHPTQHRAELVSLYVLPDYQSKGIGQAILETAFATLSKANITQCTASVKTTNIQACKFYERNGFVFHRKHGQFLGRQIIILMEYIRSI